MEPSEKKMDAIIIGGGPGGYVSAIRLAQKGLQVGVVEKRKTLGGTCLNEGCIPSKILLEASHRYASMQAQSEEFGIRCDSVSIDLDRLRERKEKLVAESCAGIDFLFQKNKVEHIRGAGRLLGPGAVEVTSEDGRVSRLSAKSVILATGSEPAPIPIEGAQFDGSQVIHSTQALALESIPQHLLVIGGGAIGLELGLVYRRLGAEVSIVEMLPRLLMGADRQIGDYLKRTLTRQGVNIYLEYGVTSAQKNERKILLQAANKKGKQIELEGETLLVAAGRRPLSKGFGLEEAGVSLTGRGFVKVNPKTFETGLPGVYAIGDLIEGPMLAHKAQEEGIAVAEVITGGKPGISYQSIPAVVYTDPEVAIVGPGEEALKESGAEYLTGTAFFKGNGRAKSMSATDGMIKVFAEPGGRLIGAHMIGPHVSELIHSVSLAVGAKLSVDQMAQTIFPHPSVSEVLREAALAATGAALHG